MGIPAKSALSVMTENPRVGELDLVGELEFGSRSKFRTHGALQRAFVKHAALGRDLTDLDSYAIEACSKVPPFTTWHKIDMLDIYEGARLPDKPGIYGFFNLRNNAEPKHRILYIGKSLNSLKIRVVKQHNQFVRSLRFGATHACYISTSVERSSRKTLINTTETYLIQEWGPYLNISENLFNFQFESLEFREHQMDWMHK